MPIIAYLTSSYKTWQDFLKHFPQTSRHSLGGKIDTLFIEIVQLIYSAGYYTEKAVKIDCISKAITRLDLMKFFLQIAWEIKAMDNKKYIIISEKLDEIGRMLGGWRNRIVKLNSGA